MRILVLQLKRIGDLVLNTPALTALRDTQPNVQISLIVADGCGALLPAFDMVDEGLVFRRGASNAAIWKKALGGKFDACLDFTGNDRSAFLTALSRAKRRITFQSVKKNALRAIAYNDFVESNVREHHTVDHYLHLLRPLGIQETTPRLHLALPTVAREAAIDVLKKLGVEAQFVLLHPGSARPEKYWRAERWAEVARTLVARDLPCAISCGPDPSEQEHVKKIVELAGSSRVISLFPASLPTLAALVERARLIVSCDTAVVHLAAAFERPQIALFGPTNPFHWRPRHAKAIVLSAAHPEEPLTNFQPRMKGAPMDGISTELVIRATEFALRSGC